jgi:hypothetical protein
MTPTPGQYCLVAMAGMGHEGDDRRAFPDVPRKNNPVLTIALARVLGGVAMFTLSNTDWQSTNSAAQQW